MTTSSKMSQTSGTRPLREPLGALDVVRVALEHELVHDERLEEFQGHPARQSALVELEVRPDGNDRPSAVVDALAEQVLPEPALLPAKQVGQRLELVVVTAGNRPASTAVVDQGIDGLLEHSLLVANDDLRGLEVDQPLEAVVPVDDPAVQVVQVAGGEPSAVKLHHRTQFRGQDRQDGKNHPFGLVAALAERLHHAKRLDGLLAPLAGRGADDFLEVDLLGVEVHRLENFKDRLGAHAVGEDLRVGGAKLAMLRLSQQVAHFEGLDLVDLRLVLVLQLRQVSFELGVDPDNLRLRLLSFLAQRFLFVLGLRILWNERGKLLDPGLGGGFKLLRLLVELEPQTFDGGLPEVLIDAGHEVLREVDDAFEVSRGQIEHQTEPTRNALGEPDVCDRGRQGYPAHALPAHLGTGHFHAAPVADDALVANLLVLSAVALPVLRRTEDLFAEQAVLLRSKGAVVDGLRLGDFAVRPDLDLLG